MAVLTHSQLESLWVIAGGTEATADTAAAIAQAESGGNTSAILNTAYPQLPGYRPPSSGALREYSVGLWQVNTLAHPQYSTALLLQPVGNANAAVAIASGGASFSAWSTYKSGAYKQFLTSGGTPGPQPGPASPAPSGPETTHAFAGWNDLQNSVNRHLPRQLRKSQMMGETALKVLARKHKVGR